MSRSLTLVMAAAALLAAPAAVSAQEGDAASTPAAQASTMSEADLNRRVCKGMVPTGSRLKKGKICKTQRQWLLDAEQDRQNLNKMQKQPLKAPG